MITREELARIAQRHETTMSDAMLRALGLKRKPKPKRAKYDRFRGARKLMKQRHGVRL